jgi:hypothetical protein
VSRAYYLLGQDLRRLGRLDEAQKALANSQRYREAKFRYDAQHIFDEPPAPSDGDSHTSDRIAALLESGASGQQKSAEAMVQSGVQENPSAQRPSASEQASESKASKEYRAFAGNSRQLLQRSGCHARQGFEFCGCRRFFKWAGA